MSKLTLYGGAGVTVMSVTNAFSVSIEWILGGADATLVEILL